MTVLVTGASGRLGGAAARALLAAGIPVRAMVRDGGAGSAAELTARGAEIVVADLGDPASLDVAVKGAAGVFSVQPAVSGDDKGEAETAQTAALVAAAKDAGVGQIVHCSAAGAGHWQENRGIPEAGTLLPYHWSAKADGEEAVRSAGFAHWTILRPALLMESLTVPLISPAGPDRPLALVAARDLGAAAAAAFADPEMYDGLQLDLAGDVRTLREVAAILGTEPPSMTVEQAVSLGMPERTAWIHVFYDRYPTPATPELALAAGIPTTTFEDWARITR